ncbi:MAG: MFS transporter [Myxococcota bacterium]|nr:MFS transporter [Myxococcota bacterium]
MLRRFFQSAVPVRGGEGKLAFALFLHGLFAVGAFVAGRSVRDALFLAHGTRDQLAWMYVASAVAVAAVGFVYNPVAARFRRDRLTVFTALSFAVLFVGAWRLEQTQLGWVYPVIYVLVEVMGALCIMQFWTFCNEVFNAGEAKRLYGLIGAGGTLSNILVGLVTSRVALTFGASALLLLCTLLLIGAAVAGSYASRAGRQRLFARAARSGPAGPSKKGGMARTLESPHLRSIALLALVSYFTITLVDFEFKVIAADVHGKNDLAAYFGRFYAIVGALALGLQLFGTSRLLNRLGVIGSLAILPLSLLISNLGVAMFRTLWAASLTKGSDALFRYSVNDATTQILYLPVAPAARASAKAFIDGVVKQLSIGLGGLALLGYRAWGGGDPYTLAWLSAGLSAVWCGLVVSARRHYIRSLQENLKHKRLDLGAVRYRSGGAEAAGVMTRALESDDPREVQGALELLPSLENVELDHRVEPLLDHLLPEVRIAALEYYAKRQALRFANSVFRRFEDPDVTVRAKAIAVCCTLGRDKAVRSVRPLLADPDPGVRSAAITGMMQYGGLDGVLSAAEALKALIADPQPKMREHAARILGEIGVRNFYQPVLELMNDPDLKVRRQAILAASRLRSPEFVLPLLYRTQSADCAPEAIDALAAFGSAITPALTKVLGNRLEDAAVRRGVARVLGRMASPEAVAVLTGHLDDPDEEVRTRVYRSLARALRGQRSLAVDKKKVAAALDRELHRAATTLAHAEALGLGSGPSTSTPRSGLPAAAALLASALSEKVDQTEQRIFLLLAVLYPDANMERIYAGIRDASSGDAARRRGNAVELLDNLLDRNLKQRLLPLLEDGKREDKLRMLADAISLVQPSAETAIDSLCRDEAAWTRACAIFYATEAGVSDTGEVMIHGLTDTSPIVREISLVGCARATPDRLDTLARPRLADDSEFVRRRAELLTVKVARA